MIKAYEIVRGIYNGKPVKFFKLKKLNGDHWVGLGGFVAPINVANKRLAKYAEEKMNESPSRM